MNLKKVLCMVGLLSAVHMYAESSVYGFGVEEGTVSNGTTSLNTMASMRQKISEQDERIDGLTSLIEGLNITINELRSHAALSTTTSPNSNDALLQKLAGMIDDINAQYVSKKELAKILKTSKSTKTLEKDVLNTKGNDATLERKSNATLYSEGVRHFVKQRYSEAKKRFTITDTKAYKPAASNYYLGEIAYYTKQYKDAIFYYKKSAGLYDKASYMDTLLLHTAISLDETRKKDQAKVFYENIIENYPEKKTAKIAQDRLRKL